MTAVDAFALGDEVGIEAGDRIMKVNGRELRDFLDFQFYTGSEDRVRLDVIKKSGEAQQIDVEVGEGEIWGLDFEYFAPRQCANDCIFCFCNQNPEGSRESLFFKDEDTRLSFLHGNYTTMSSISKMELDRIVEQRLSPQYVSVHATDPEVRRYLLGRKRADDVMAKMRYLADQGIELHAQIVLCPTINDGEVLRRTIDGPRRALSRAALGRGRPGSLHTTAQLSPPDDRGHKRLCAPDHTRRATVAARVSPPLRDYVRLSGRRVLSARGAARCRAARTTAITRR